MPNWADNATLLVPGLPRANRRLTALARKPGFGSSAQMLMPPVDPRTSGMTTWTQAAANQQLTKQATSTPTSSFATAAAPVIAAAAGPVAVPNSTPATDNPFWRDKNGYGGRDITDTDGDGNNDEGKDWYNTDIGEGEGDDFVQGEWERFLTHEGFGGFDRRSNWARALFGRAMNGYEAAKQSNPELTFRRYLGTLQGYLENAWAGLTNNERGVGIPTQSKTIYMG